MQTVQIAGLWGLWLCVARAVETADAVADITTTIDAVSSRASVEAGHTLLIDTEQMYVQSCSSNTLTVVRGVNSTAASHAGSTAIDIYQYPGAIAEATIIQWARLWRRRDGAYSGNGGPAGAIAGPDEDVRLMLGQFRRHALGVGVWADEIKDAKDGLVSLLAGISGLTVVDYPAASINQLPAAIVLFESRKANQLIGGSSFTGQLKVVLLVSSADAQQAYDALDSYMDPLGAASLEAAVDADNTWGGSVDDGRLVSIDNIGPHKQWGSAYVGADFHFGFVKSVAG